MPNHISSCQLKNEVWLICSKLTGDLLHGKRNIPWRWQVHNFNPLEAALARVNVPNHVRSCRLKNEVWPICSKLTGELPHGEGNILWRWQVPTTIPWGAVQVRVNVPNHVWSRRPWMIHHPGQGKAGRTLVSTLPLKNWTQVNLPKTHRGPSHGRANIPWRQQVLTTIPRGAVQVQVNVPNHVWSHQPWMMHHPGQGKAGRTLVSTLPLKNWTQVDLPKTHRGPSPW